MRVKLLGKHVMHGVKRENKIGFRASWSHSNRFGAWKNYDHQPADHGQRFNGFLRLPYVVRILTKDIDYCAHQLIFVLFPSFYKINP